MEAGLTGVLTSENLTKRTLYNALFPYYLSLGMPADEYWNGDPELVNAYFQAELFRVRRKQREMWYEGIYIHQAIASTLSSEADYFDAPLPDTVEDRERMIEKQQEDAQQRLEARMLAWGKTGG